ncbi:hypothetical protein [Mycobacteroides abscessus]|uniref:Uncharacterized protein n=1 Tax=Mycobacteroides abscessus TaxID=36809 RepID=A0A0U0ZJ33_9MYCO|nr:hypothetical protein [Mycobacteroides abscessus]MBL3733215.1 hypothetical protein [Mycobacteroides abscessus subsp. massiliense]MBL3761538.1 hypothetical protein [Mycobacteroides abscessus subsp. massiliense]MBN7478964.1 hypothetical protein [Mycobacteroides abscessus subsp. massiliense]MDM2103178.1 hypothetical protein [Mycobacteroides abscessus]MDM2134737.1 hypothetical protein [Mycobacteroides abscessus]
MRTTDIVKPYRVQLVHDEDNRLVEINIKAADGNELDHDTVKEATRSLTDHFRREQIQQRNQLVRDSGDALEKLAAAYAKGQGKVTDVYLARLAEVYDQLAQTGASILVTLSVALAKPIPTIRTHIKRAEEKGYLTPTTQGSTEGRQSTPLARQVILDGA